MACIGDAYAAQNDFNSAVNNYKAAAAKLAGKEGYNAALVALLNGNNAPAAALKCQCPQAAYLRAVAAARQGNAAGVATNLDAAKACEKLAARAAKVAENNVED